MTYYLNRERMRLVKTNDKGKVTKRKKYRFGDEVDVETFLDDERLDALVEKGALVEDESELDRRAGWKRQVTGTYSPEQARGQATNVVAGAVGAAGAGMPSDADGATGDAGSAADDFPSYTDRPRPAGWEDFSDEEKRAYIYEGYSDTLTPEANHLETPSNSKGAPVTTSDNGPKTEAGDDVEIVDEYSDMDYKGLQEAAKEKGLKFVSVSADDLRASLRANDES